MQNIVPQPTSRFSFAGAPVILKEIGCSHVIVRGGQQYLIFRNAQTVSSSIVSFDRCYVLFSYTCTLRGQRFMCKIILTDSFLPAFCEAKFCRVLPCM
jgi:hypothetical protein